MAIWSGIPEHNTSEKVFFLVSCLYVDIQSNSKSKEDNKPTVFSYNFMDT